ncbi:MAG: bacillithiol biosynthesis BshC, partial [Bacteroidota bacterium]
MYKRELLPFSKVPQFSERDKAYQQEDPRLRPFYKHDVGLSSFANVIEHRAKFKTDRDILVRELLKSYDDIDNNATVLNQIKLLADPSTYTIVTAHQPSLLTGPLYFIYKICSAISLARQVDEAYDHVRVVPVFILGGEDHDFAEIATARLFGREFTWQTEQKGACGRMSTDRLEEVLREVKDTFGAAPHAEELMELIDRSVQNAKSYGDFMFRLVHELFGRHGLIIANMDNASMKQVLLPYLEKDLESQSSHQAVTADQASLEAAGFKAQAHAREVNIFLHREDRERVIWTGDGYQVGEELFHPDEFVEYLRNDPGRISPNVILRPIFQEVILPNLAYVGGGG